MKRILAVAALVLTVLACGSPAPPVATQASTTTRASDEPEIIDRQTGGASTGGAAAAPGAYPSQGAPGGYPPPGPQGGGVRAGATADAAYSSVGPYGGPAPYYGGGYVGEGLAAFHSENVDRPADIAAVFTIRSYDPSRGQYNQAERDRIIEQLKAAGFADGDITFPEAGYGPYGRVLVKVPVGALPDAGNRVVAAIESAVDRPEQAGVRFSLRDCAGAVAAARRTAIERVRAKASELAGAASVTLGPLTALSEYVYAQSYSGPDQTDQCATEIGPHGGPGTFNFDAEPVARFTLSINAVYGLGQGPDERVVSSFGTGSVTARADGARVVIFGEPEYGPEGPNPLSREAEERLIADIEKLGVSRVDIDVESAPYGGPTQVAVRVPLDRVKELGEAIEDEVNDEVARVYSKGVVFTHTNCEPLRRAAREQAMADARPKAETLAAAAGLRLGPVVGLSESEYYSPYGYGLGPACDAELSARDYGYGPLASLDSAPVVDLASSVSAVYRLEG